MYIILAGYNIDLDALKDKKSVLTPETFSSAYARISRSPKSVSELRAIARKEITKAREQNRRIIFEMGHHAVAEHSVFNFDIMDISRYAIEHLESHRLMSYTEASQRYIEWNSKFVIPYELKKSKLLPQFLRTIKIQNNAYQTLVKKLKPYETKLAKPIEDARYVTSLAMQTQLGATMNARNLELLIRRCASSDISEVRILGEKLYNLVIKIAPSIILFYEPTEYDKKTYSELKEIYHRFTPPLLTKGEGCSTKESSLLYYPYKKGRGAPETRGEHREKTDISCKLIDYTADGDDKIIAGIIHRVSNISFIDALKQVKKLSYSRKLEYIKKSFQYANLYDATLREFEHSYLTFELIVSAACFGQLKRHRIATITAQDYDLNLGVTLPETIRQGGQTDLFNRVIEMTEKTYKKIYKELPQVTPYILTQSHRRRVLLTVNIRELYHIARLRMDATAQWDIRDITNKMLEQAQKVMPLSLLFCGAKDRFDLTHQKYFPDF